VTYVKKAWGRKNEKGKIIHGQRLTKGKPRIRRKGSVRGIPFREGKSGGKSHLTTKTGRMKIFLNGKDTGAKKHWIERIKKSKR